MALVVSLAAVVACLVTVVVVVVLSPAPVSRSRPAPAAPGRREGDEQRDGASWRPTASRRAGAADGEPPGGSESSSSGGDGGGCQQGVRHVRLSCRVRFVAAPPCWRPDLTPRLKAMQENAEKRRRPSPRLALDNAPRHEDALSPATAGTLAPPVDPPEGAAMKFTRSDAPPVPARLPARSTARRGRSPSSPSRRRRPRRRRDPARARARRPSKPSRPPRPRADRAGRCRPPLRT